MAAALASRTKARSSLQADTGGLDLELPIEGRRRPCHCALELPCHFELVEAALALRSVVEVAVVAQAAFAVPMVASSGTLAAAYT